MNYYVLIPYKENNAHIVDRETSKPLYIIVASFLMRMDAQEFSDGPSYLCSKMVSADEFKPTLFGAVTLTDDTAIVLDDDDDNETPGFHLVGDGGNVEWPDGGEA